MDATEEHTWQAREILVEASPSQPMQVDGELAGRTPAALQVIPRMVNVPIPR